MNFLTEGIGTTITVNQVESDGYEVKNLLATDPSLHSSRGFLAESFVRPPLTISIKFPLCIELSHIVINPKLGKQITSAILIHTETNYRSWNKEQSGPISSHLVAKEYINTSPIPNVIVFRNPRFVLRRPFSNLPSDHYSRYRNHDVIYNLKHPSFNANQRVVGMEITILRVAGSSVPALGGLQVWGQPCIRCSQDQIDKLYLTWNRILKRNESLLSPNNHTSDSSDEGSAAKKPKLSSKESELSIPDEFMDSITCEIMCQPIRLPCGLAVDAITLEKYYAEEAKFGRLPNDPFTGLTFTEVFKPIADTALKNRINSFVTLNKDNPILSDIPRTLGSSRTSSTLYNMNYVFRNPNLSSTSGRRYSSTVTSFTTTSHEDLESFRDPYLQIPKEEVKPRISSPKATVVSADLKPDDKMNMELYKFLSSGSNYLSKNKSPVKPKIDKQCKDCGLMLNLTQRISNFYIGRCSHVILCRICLSKTDKQARKKCAQCGVEWRAKDCLRIFI